MYECYTKGKKGELPEIVRTVTLYFNLVRLTLTTSPRGAVKFEGNKIHCFPIAKDQLLSDLLHSKTK